MSEHDEPWRHNPRPLRANEPPPHPEPPVTADHAPERLTREGLGRLLDRLLTEHWPNSGVNPWYLADLIREHDAIHPQDPDHERTSG